MRHTSTSSPFVASALALVASLSFLGEPAAEPSPAKSTGAIPSSKSTRVIPSSESSGAIPASGFSFGLNPPFRWSEGNLAGSMSFGFERHHALRFNLAHYLPLSADDGGITDLSVGWVYYPRRLWSGLTFEAGAVARWRDFGDDTTDDFDDYTLETDSRALSARVLVGWSWRLGSRFYFATALGFSFGYETGEETKILEDQSSATASVHRGRTDFEGYVRFGLALTN